MTETTHITEQFSGIPPLAGAFTRRKGECSMSSTNLSRRAILAGAASVPLALPAAVAVALPAIIKPAAPLPVAGTAALPMPPLSASAAKPDPIFAALAEHRRLYREWSSLCNELDEAEGKVKERPRSVLIAWRNYSAIGYSEIERVRDEFLSQPRANRKKIEREYQKAKADERAAHRAEREWYKRNGLAKLKAETLSAGNAESRAKAALAKIRPTTPAGVGALITFIRNDLKIGHDEWQEAALANAARALLAMPDEALPSFAGDGPDLDLLNAATNMQASDATIDRLHKRHGDDADGREDYQEVAAKRDIALDTLAGDRARSWKGMVAKAEALSEPRLIEDFARHGQIATSLAADVLRHFGARLA